MHNRNSTKWNPFNSLINGNNLINELIIEKSKNRR